MSNAPEVGRSPPEEGRTERERHAHRTKLPVIPDLRFEYAYLKSIKPFVEVERVDASPNEVIKIQWKQVLWVTLKDQLFAPLLQGALWGVASIYIRPMSKRLGSKLGTFVRKHGPKTDGQGISWLRNWFRSLGLRSNNEITTQSPQLTG